VSTFIASDLSARAAQSVRPARPHISIAESSVLDLNPLVSVIIPCYNGETFLEETITSALVQTYHNVEVIVIDDGSTDGSAAIAQKFPVRYIPQKNRGLTPTRNRGIRESRGSYIVFLDADDRLRPDAIEAGLRAFAENPVCAMTVGDHLFVSHDGSHLSDSNKQCLPNSHYEALLRSNFVEMISSVLFRKSALEKVGGFDTGLRVAEDYDLYLRIARDNPICCHSSVIAEYRLHQTNASHNSELMLVKTLEVLQSQVGYARRNARHLFAYLSGVRNWRKQYGRQLASELARSYPVLEGASLRRKLLLLLNYYPQGLVLLLLLRLRPGLSRRKTLQTAAEPVAENLLPQKWALWLSPPKPHSTKQLG
jgi:glycosyltransferase involved in cell wall biosynthesis